MSVKLIARRLWRTFIFIRQYLYRLLSNVKYRKKPLNIGVLTIEETLKFILENNSSVVRFGDGELDIMAGNDIPFQIYNEKLAESLKEIAALDSRKELIVCIPQVFSDLKHFIPASINSWAIHRQKRYGIYDSYFSSPFYGNAFISRPYYMFKDKTKVENRFNKLKKIWANKDLLIIEGVTSRSGVGNDLFSNANSVNRIICPSKNAYDKYEEIFNAAIRFGNNRLILLMLGPTAKCLALDLSKKGFQAIDIGHIDTEYEWFKMGAKEKVKLPSKHTAEHNYDIDINLLYDKNYENEILINLK